MPTALIADDNTARAAQLREILDEAGFECTSVAPDAPPDTPADVLFVAGDTPGASGSDALVLNFARHEPGSPVVVVSDAPLWGLITLAVRGRAWMDLPRTGERGTLLPRYAASRLPCPAVVVEASAAQCARLLEEWPDSPRCVTEPLLTRSVGDALEAAIDGRVPVLLNLSIPPGTHDSPDVSTLIYSLCPAVIAALIEASNTQRTYRSFVHTEPRSRFAVLKPPFRSSELKTLLANMDVAWPMTSPL